MVFQKSYLSFVILFIAGVNCRYANQPSMYVFETANALEDEFEDRFSDNDFGGYPVENHIRVARQAGSISSNPDGGLNLNMKAPLAGNDKNVLSALGSVSGYHMNGPKKGEFAAVGGGLGLDNVNGHGLSLTGTHLPGMGNQLTGAGRLNLLNTDNHNLNANAFLTKTFPSVPNVPDFTTRGGSLDYMFKNKVGASIGVANTPLFQKTDYSAMGNLNLFRDRHSSLDFNAGLSKSVSPFIPKSSWQPSAGIGYTRFW